MSTDPSLPYYFKLAPAFLSVFANLTKSRSHSPHARGSDSLMGQQSSKKSRKATKDVSYDGSTPDDSTEAAVQSPLTRVDDLATANGSQSSLNGSSAPSAFGLLDLSLGEIY